MSLSQKIAENTKKFESIIQQLRYEIQQRMKWARDTENQIDSLILERDKLRECLKWYADEGNWRRNNGVPSATMVDEGNRARTILSQLEESK